MTKAELLRFAARQTDYLNARNLILQKWDEDVTQYLTAEACVGAAEDGTEAIVAEAHRFLQEQGCINLGVPHGEPAEEEQPVEEGVSDEDLQTAVFEVLRMVDITVATEKMIRKQLEKNLGVDLGERKAFIREQVTLFCAGKLPPASKKAKKKAKAKPGKVIVVGAGPAGLAAALHLKRCGVETVMLEARDRVGGRVHSCASSGFGAPVDLGASIITGTDTVVAKGLRPDPSTLVARQLGLTLYPIRQHMLPIYDGLTGQAVSDATDRAVERVRDALLDDARERVDSLGEAATEAESLGAALERAFAQRFSRETAAAAAGTTGAAAPADGEDEVAGTSAVAETTAAEPAAAPADSKDEPQPNGIAGAANAGSGGVDTEMADANGSVGGDGAVYADKHDMHSSVEDNKAPAQASDEKGSDAAGDRAAAVKTSDDSTADGAPGSSAEVKPEVDSATGHGSDAAPTAEAGSSAEAKAEGEVQMEEPEEEPLLTVLDEAERRLLDWHWSNLEYGCSASLDQVSLVHWNQDEEYGGFGGQHCMVTGGYDPILKALASRLDVRLSSPVTAVSDTSDGVTVTIASGEMIKGAAVIITVPLGCLKAGDVTFDPPLPAWKAEAVTKLGFGDLNKVVLEFPHAFWEDSADFFGAAVPGGPGGRGRCFMFWNLQPVSGKPILISLVSGKAAYDSESMSDEEMSAAAMEVLKRLYGEDIPVPVCSRATKWGSDIYSRGSYSYVAVGASAKTYDALAAPVRRRVLWAGEHTCKEHPDTVGGAMLTGMREAVRALHLLTGDDDAAAQTAAAQVDSVAAAKRRASRDVDDDEDFLEDDSDDGRAKPQKKSKSKSKKRRASAAEEDDEDEPASPVEARKRRAREPAREPELPMSREERAAEMARRETQREETKAIIRILFSAGMDDMEPLRAKLSEAADTEARSAILRALLDADSDALAALAGDAACLRALDLWLLQLVPEARAFHTLELALKVLNKMPVRMAMLRSSGIAGTVSDRVASHPNRIVREAAARLAARWAGKPARPPAPAQAPAAPASAALQNGAGRLPGLDERQATPGSEEDAAEMMDPDLLEKLAAAQRAEDEAKELAKKREELEEEMRLAREAAAELPAIHAFGEGGKGKRSGRYREEKLARRRARADEALAEADVEGVASGSGGSSHHKRSSRDHASGSSHAHNANPKVKKDAEKFVADFLKPMYADKSISREDYKWIMQKSINKILELATAKGSDNFLSSKRKPKIEVLIEKYVQLRKDGA
ncbi:hypothetical protein WJX75_005208 [Coccomyxa subellipsoidea]|uniref:SWIRM-domain-containing protein n=1 Tax=Coccomyxa subellipsoidea TaxID=248742 RepID=A0ABR2YE87_9CHLO